MALLWTLAAGGNAWASAPAPKRLWVVDGFEEPLVAIGRPSPSETRALADAIRRFRRQAPQADLTAFDDFLRRFPSSPWTVSLLTDLGIAEYDDGYFSAAIASWQRAWEQGRNITDPAGHALVDRAVGELIQMHARLGHAREVAALLADMENRPIGGSASEDITGAREGLWLMRHDPGKAYLCGPMALRNLLLAKYGPAARHISVLENYRSGPKGVSLGALVKLARRAGMPLRAEFRAGGSRIPVPSVVNWKLHHYAAIVGERNGRYRVMDPTFGDELWLTARAINTETSGFFLVPKSWRADGWRPASRRELKDVYGMGNVKSVNKAATSTLDISSGQGCRINPTPMCGYRIQSLVVGLTISDTPVGYRPPVGPPAMVTLTYSQRDASQPAIPTYFNFGPKWTSNWSGYVEDNPAAPSASVKRIIPGGGYYTETGFDPKTDRFRPESRDRSVLVRVSADPIRYEQRFRNGSVHVYAQSDGATAAPRRIFLSKVVDPVGNTVTLSYGMQLRLLALTDATGRKTTFTYGLPGHPLLVTRITDPFGRFARIDYDRAGHLARITDIIGIVSEVGYDRNGVVDTLRTPYGTSHFSYTEKGIERSLNATDPLGYTERVEFHQGAAGIPIFANIVPRGIGVTNRYLQFRNTFYWDKNAYQQAPGDYRKAEIIHWFHQMPGVAAGTVESIKYPLENRIWFNDPGSRGFFTGNYDVASRIARVLDDGSTQLTAIDYNAQGNAARIVDAAGRMTLLDYAPNGVDLVSVRQRSSPRGFTKVAAFTYNAHHELLTFTDAAGQTTKFRYNAAGERTAATNAQAQSTEYRYDKLGYLTDIIDANGKVVEHLSYDKLGRVAARTGARGGTVTYRYDAMNRPLKVTYPDGSSESYAWKRLDLASFTNRNGAVTRFAYDDDRRLVRRTGPLGATTLYSYYPGGQLRSRTDADGHKTTWLRDIEGRVIARVDPSGATTRDVYATGTGRLESVTDALGQTRLFKYTLDDRIASRRYAHTAEPMPPVNFVYDRYFPRLLSMTDANGTTTYAYGQAGKPGALQPVSVTGPGQHDVLRYRYDALGRLLGSTLESRVENLSYDTLGRLAARQNGLGRFTYGYLGETDLPMRQSLAGSPFAVQWHYLDPDKGGGLKGIRYGDAFAVSLQTSPLGQVLQSGSQAERRSYAYDAAGRLISAAGPAAEHYRYSYDPAGNLLDVTSPAGSRRFSVDVVDRIRKTDQATYRYDADGNLTEDARHHYLWDAEGRLIEITYKQARERVSRFRYDGVGRRVADIEKTAKGTIETRLIWCGTQLCQVRDSRGKVLQDIYADGEVDAANHRKRLYARDQIGSVRALLSAADGKVRARYDYDPYGALTRRTGDTLPAIGYAGLWYHAPSGLNLSLFRAYDPRIGRWLSRDRIDSVTGNSPYAYADNDPIGRYDPLGLAPCSGSSGVCSGASGVSAAANGGTDQAPTTPPVPCPSVVAGNATSQSGGLRSFLQNIKDTVGGAVDKYSAELNAARQGILTALSETAEEGSATAVAADVAEISSKVSSALTAGEVGLKSLALYLDIKNSGNAIDTFVHCDNTGTCSAGNALVRAQKLNDATGRYLSNQR